MFIFTFIISWIYGLNIAAHDFHTSLAQIYYNKTSKAFEVTLRVFTDDLETALAQENGNKKVNLADVKQSDPVIISYLNKNLAIITGQNQKKAMNYVGKEVEVDVTWMYVEIPMSEEINEIQIQNSILTEIFDDQVNIVNLKYLSVERTYLFKSKQTIQKVNVE